MMLCALLLLALVAQLAFASRTTLPVAARRATAAPRAVTASAIPAFPLLEAGSVFSPDRAGAGGGGAAGIGGGDSCTALGVSIIGRDAVALIGARGVAAQAVRVGQDACGWKVSQITRNAVELVQSGQRRTLVVGREPPAADVTAAQPQQGPESAE
jgi:hypothetical protein